ncbi:MAG: AraC family transcriptional regulator [Segniliparus sp.]|uniref:AraC family transcriptional regulator n=1 Tax=Segniliparus sp. TaxID=2804064 RepID=UPI003F3A5C19
MSQNSHDAPAAAELVGRLVEPGHAMVLGDVRLRSGHWFSEHVHDDHHQLVWAARGVVAVSVEMGAAAGKAQWVLPTTRALWLPAGVAHRTGAIGGAVLRGVYCPANRTGGSLPHGDWRAPRLIRVGPLLRELLGHLLRADLAPDARERAEAVLFDLLEPMSVIPIRAPMPTDPRAAELARRLVANPADGAVLRDLARGVGASERTLSRIWAAQTGLSFGQWRTQVRLRAALPLLAEGKTVERVAERTGYCSASAFAAAFRRAVGVSPARYFA